MLTEQHYLQSEHTELHNTKFFLYTLYSGLLFVNIRGFNNRQTIKAITSINTNDMNPIDINTVYHSISVMKWEMSCTLALMHSHQCCLLRESDVDIDIIDL